jgi:lactoylglutathione lyase
VKGTFSYVGIRVKDMDESLEFYTKILGMSLTGRSKSEATKGETAGLQSRDGGFTLELNYYGKGSPYNSKYNAGEALDHLAFQVKNLDNALKEAAKAGHPTKLRMKGKTSEWAYVEDPNGIWIELFE